MKTKPNEAVLLRIPSHLKEQISELIAQAGYNLRGDGNYFRVELIPYLIKEEYEQIC